MQITKEELLNAAYDITGGSLSDLTHDQILKLMTVTQYVTDICLNEIEDRGKLTFLDDVVIVPYQCEHYAETILTRPEIGA